MSTTRRLTGDSIEVKLKLNMEAAMASAEKDTIINTKELRASLKEVLDGVRDGRRYTVLYRSKPAFRIVPVDEDMPARRRALRDDPIYGSGPLGRSGEDDVAAGHDDLIYSP